MKSATCRLALNTAIFALCAVCRWVLSMRAISGAHVRIQRTAMRRRRILSRPALAYPCPPGTRRAAIGVAWFGKTTLGSVCSSRKLGRPGGVDVVQDGCAKACNAWRRNEARRPLFPGRSRCGRGSIAGGGGSKVGGGRRNIAASPAHLHDQAHRDMVAAPRRRAGSFFRRPGSLPDMPNSKPGSRPARAMPSDAALRVLRRAAAADPGGRDVAGAVDCRPRSRTRLRGFLAALHGRRPARCCDFLGAYNHSFRCGANQCQPHFCRKTIWPSQALLFPPPGLFWLPANQTLATA